VVAGGVAGRHRRTRKGALAQGCAVGLLLATAVITATALRYLVLGASVSASTGQVWIAAAVTAVIAAAAGGLLGRRAYLRSRRRKAKTT
jgi:ABC-type antimicrobial peptide transport system permease subunit